MKKIIYLFTLILCLASCSSKKVVTKTDVDLTTTSQTDSVSSQSSRTDSGSSVVVQKNVYDSIITHIVIERYDTAYVLRERVYVDQYRISRDNSQTEANDSTHLESRSEIQISQRDSLDYSDKTVTTTYIDKKKGKATLFVLLLIVGMILVSLRLYDKRH